MTAPVWRRPIWLLGHVVALSAVVAFVRLGVWQLDRLDEKKARNRIIAERADGPAIDLSDVVVERAAYQHVVATGRFDPSGEVLIRNRSFQGSVGAHVVTPLVVDDGAVLVNRGWVPLDGEPAPAPTGVVTVEGLLFDTQERTIGPTDPPDGLLDVLNRVDVGRIDQQYGADLYPLYLSQSAPDAEGDYPIRLPPPARDEGPHQSYAVQWFLFAGVVVVGYPLLLRRRSATDQSSVSPPSTAST